MVRRKGDVSSRQNLLCKVERTWGTEEKTLHKDVRVLHNGNVGRSRD